MIEPELDDGVEQNYGYAFLTSSIAGGSLLAGMMSAGAERAPLASSKVDALDPGKVLSPDQEQLRRRLEQICPAAGRYYVGMLQGVAESRERVTAVSDTFNNAREMVSALLEVLLAVVDARAEHDGQDPPRPTGDGSGGEA